MSTEIKILPHVPEKHHVILSDTLQTNKLCPHLIRINQNPLNRRLSGEKRQKIPKLGCESQSFGETNSEGVCVQRYEENLHETTRNRVCG